MPLTKETKLNLTGTTTPGQSGPECNHNEGVLNTLQDWGLTMQFIVMLRTPFIPEGALPLCREIQSAYSMFRRPFRIIPCYALQFAADSFNIFYRRIFIFYNDTQEYSTAEPIQNFHSTSNCDLLFNIFSRIFLCNAICNTLRK